MNIKAIISRSLYWKSTSQKIKRLRKATRDKRQYVENLARSAKEASVNGDLSEVYKITKELITTHATIEQPVLDKDGALLSSKDEQLRRCKEHFSAVLNLVVSYEAPPYAQALSYCNPGRNIPTIAFSKSEIYSVIKALQAL